MNQKDPEVIERFIALRAQGTPLARISAELSVSKRTLIDWSRKFAERIQNERALEDELLAEKLKISRRTCLTHISSFHDRIVEELQRRQLDQVPTPQLLKMSIDLRKEAHGPGDRIKLSTPFTQADLDQGDAPKPIISWEV